LFAAIAGLPKLANLIYHGEFLQNAMKFREFDYFYPLAS